MKLTACVLAHVDAGKTTFSERVLYLTHAIRAIGRVDHQNSFLDTHPLEKQRGITIFSGQAHFQLEDKEVYWLDTPGHVDLSTEMERAVSVIDYAILVVSAVDGVQSHTETVWQLLKRYQVPTFLFLNKCDRDTAHPDAVLAEIQRRLSPDAIDLRTYQASGHMDEPLREALAERDEPLLDALFSGDDNAALWTSRLTALIAQRQVFPVMSGSALSGEGVEAFLHLFACLTATDYHMRLDQPPAGRVYRVRHNAQGARCCFIKLLCGRLRVKDEVPVAGEKVKINELRRYHGEQYQPLQEAQAGDLIGIPGLEGAVVGSVIGEGLDTLPFCTEPMMAADVLWDTSALPAFQMLQRLRILEDEDPMLGLSQQGDRITVHIMGAIQLDILRQLVQERFGLDIAFGPCRVLYRETIAAPSIGIGHYEPLRHYAEVQLRLVPAAPGSGIHFRSLAHVDDLELNWQRLIETHVLEKTHKGVLTGAPLTDVTVELLCGRAHPKHTEGGDFRQATYRAIRNALMYAQSVLLEPICGFELHLPFDSYGTATGALNKMLAQTQPPVFSDDGSTVTLCGEAPYALFAPWQEQYMMLTHGRGTLRVWTSRYAPCHNAQEIIDAACYQPLADDTPDSVFCSHGAGFTVAWNRVRDFAHCPIVEE